MIYLVILELEDSGGVVGTVVGVNATSVVSINQLRHLLFRVVDSLLLCLCWFACFVFLLFCSFQTLTCGKPLTWFLLGGQVC